jgi:hypothetical protein
MVVAYAWIGWWMSLGSDVDLYSKHDKQNDHSFYLLQLRRCQGAIADRAGHRFVETDLRRRRSRILGLDGQNSRSVLRLAATVKQ